MCDRESEGEYQMDRRIHISPQYPSYWEFEGRPVLLLGGSVEDNLMVHRWLDIAAGTWLETRHVARTARLRLETPDEGMQVVVVKGMG